MTTLSRVVAAVIAACAFVLPASATSVALSPIVIEFVTPGGPMPVRAEIYVPGPGASGELVARLPTEPYLRFHNGGESVEPETLTARNYAVPGGRQEVVEATFGDNVVRWTATNAAGFRFGTGTYTVQRRGSVHHVPFVVRTAHDRTKRFDPMPTTSVEASTGNDFGGRWAVQFAGEDTPSVGVFEVDADTGIATGTFLNATGDYRFLEGRADGRLLRLSAFDGSHAFLFNGVMQSDGTIFGSFWSGNWYHDTWTAERDENAVAPDSFGQTTATVDRLTPEALGALTFDRVIATGLRRVSGEPDATTPEVRTETLGQVLPDGMPRMLYIFGTWCPNCADATRTVNGFFQRYGSRGLRVAGLAFEHDTGRAVDLLDRYAEKNGLRFPMMVGGFSDKAAAGERVPFLDKVRAYPTTVFIRRDGTIAGVHSGFSGPATGDAYRELIQEWDALIREIVQ